MISRAGSGLFGVWATHPWRFFWGSLALFFVGVFALTGTVQVVREASDFFGWVVYGGSAAVVGLAWLSAVHGLRMAWRRSRVKAVLIVLVLCLPVVALPVSLHRSREIQHEKRTAAGEESTAPDPAHAVTLAIALPLVLLVGPAFAAEALDRMRAARRLRMFRPARRRGYE